MPHTPQITVIFSPAAINAPKTTIIPNALFKEKNGKKLNVNCGLDHVLNWRGCLKNPRNYKKLAPTQNTIVSNTFKEGTSFADITKASNQSEIAIPTSPASIQQNPALCLKNFPPLQNSQNLNTPQPHHISNTENLDIIICKLRKIETILSNIIKLASNPALSLDFFKGLLNVKV